MKRLWRKRRRRVARCGAIQRRFNENAAPKAQ